MDDWDSELNEIQSVDKVAIARKGAIEAQDKAIDAEIRMQGFTGEVAEEWRRINKLISVIVDQREEVVSKAIKLLPEGIQIAHLNEMTRLFGLSTEQNKKLMEILDSNARARLAVVETPTSP